MTEITIVGLGPGDPGDITLAAWAALGAARRVLLRTRRHPCAGALPPGPEVSDCDDLYEAHAFFAAVYDAIAARVIELGSAPGGVVYAVPGHPWVGEATTRRVLDAADAAGLGVRVVGGLSFVEPSFATVGVDLMDGSQVVDGMLLAAQHYPQVETSLPLLVAQVYARWLASDVKLTLLAAYPPEHPVRVIQAAGTAQARTRTVALHELDHADNSDAFDHATSVYVPPLGEYRSLSALLEIVAHLRAPEGCPWDREQTLASLRRDLLGECAELLEAIDAEADGTDNSPHIAEELGDALLVLAMMAQIAAEEGRFLLGDAVYGIVTKLIRRHPHVFGDVAVEGVERVLANWDAIKAQEKAARGVAVGPLDGVPAALPALEKARELQAKAAKAGLLDRVAVAHANPALAAALGDAPDADAFGAALWQLVALAKERGVDAEDALREYAVRFRKANVE